MFKPSLSYQLILASKSPRRQDLLKGLGYDFEIRTKEVKEIYPLDLKREEVALFLSELKSDAFKNEVNKNEIIITSDTIVCLGSEILGKPKNEQDAIQMLLKLQDNQHQVITAVTLMSKNKRVSFFSETKVFFKPLSVDEITYYVTNFKPMDKAGSYGIQEWIGYVGIEKIEGSYFNVMGFPVHQINEELIKF